MQFDRSYRESVRLHDGTEVTLRLLRPSDAPLLVEGFEQLSADSRYQRFLTPKARLTAREVEYLTHVDGHDHFAIAALAVDLDGRERGLGVARFIRLRDCRDTADAAVTVTDEAQHKGLGTQLLTRLVAAAKERGVRQLHFDVLADNAPMLALLHRIAPQARERIEAGVATVEMPLEYPNPAESP